MKTGEKLNTLKEEFENLNKKLAELTDEELAQVSGGNMTVKVSVPPNGSAVDLILQLLKAKPQLMQSKDELMNIAVQMDRDEKKRAILEFDLNSRLICVSIG